VFVRGPSHSYTPIPLIGTFALIPFRCTRHASSCAARQEAARAHRVASSAGLFGGARAARAGQRVDIAGLEAELDNLAAEGWSYERLLRLHDSGAFEEARSGEGGVDFYGYGADEGPDGEWEEVPCTLLIMRMRALCTS
jgi:hypothetical protein